MFSIRNALVRLTTSDGAPRGGGCHIGGGRILTAAHLIADLLDLPEHSTSVPVGPIAVDFPWVEAACRVATVTHWGPAETAGTDPMVRDLAILQLDGVPERAGIALLRDVRRWEDRELSVWGFPDGHDVGLRLVCTTGGLASDGTVQLDDVKQQTHWIKPGFSGGIAWDGRLDAAVGVVVTTARRQSVHVAHMVPLEILQRLWPDVWASARQAAARSRDDYEGVVTEMARRLKAFSPELRVQALEQLPDESGTAEDDDHPDVFARRLLRADLFDIFYVLERLADEATTGQTLLTLYEQAAPFATVDSVAAADTRDGLMAKNGVRARIGQGLRHRESGHLVLRRSSAGLRRPIVCEVSPPAAEDQVNGFVEKVLDELRTVHHCRPGEGDPAALAQHLRRHMTVVLVPSPAPDDGTITALTSAFPEVFFLFLAQETDCERGGIAHLLLPVLCGDEDELIWEYQRARRHLEKLQQVG